MYAGPVFLDRHDDSVAVVTVPFHRLTSCAGVRKSLENFVIVLCWFVLVSCDRFQRIEFAFEFLLDRCW